MYQTLVKPLAQDIKKFILDTLFPIHCVICDKEGVFICPDCQNQLSPVDRQYCIICQKPTPFGLTHPGCQTPHGPDGAISIYNYHDKKVSAVLIDGKYKFLPGIYQHLGKILSKKLQTELFSLITEPVLVPLPLHRSRKRWRGFNQAEILCQTISQELNFPVISALVRKRSTKTQKDLKRDERLKNMTGAFALKKGVDVHGKNLVLIDDVTTTGSTLIEACQVLKRNGGAKVICLTVAKD